MNVQNLFTSKEYTQLDRQIKNVEELESLGLSADEIQLYLNYQHGLKCVQTVYKNMEKTELLNKIQLVLNKVSSMVPKENTVSKDPTNNEGKVLNRVLLSHPINYLDELEEDLFGHMDMETIPSATKRRKLLRRMDRKYRKQIKLPEPIKTNEHLANNHPSTSQTIHLNDFIGTTAQRQNLKKPCDKTNSRWDVRHIPTQEKPPSENVAITKQMIGCKDQCLYTIRNKTIMRLERISSQNCHERLHNEDLKMCKLTNIVTPTNKAEEKLLEGRKLSLDEIKAIPRFENYQPGTESNVLFLKNISKSVTEKDLVKLFKWNEPLKISLLVGRMKGQAFVTFIDNESAMKALSQTNGTIIKGKPIIIEYRKQK